MTNLKIVQALSQDVREIRPLFCPLCSKGLTGEQPMCVVSNNPPHLVCPCCNLIVEIKINNNPSEKTMEINEQSRLRLFLEEYERLCKKYSLYVSIGSDEKYNISERIWRSFDLDMLAVQMKELKKGGINE